MMNPYITGAPSHKPVASGLLIPPTKLIDEIRSEIRSADSDLMKGVSANIGHPDRPRSAAPSSSHSAAAAPHSARPSSASPAVGQRAGGASVPPVPPSRPLTARPASCMQVLITTPPSTSPQVRPLSARPASGARSSASVGSGGSGQAAAPSGHSASPNGLSLSVAVASGRPLSEALLAAIAQRESCLGAITALLIQTARVRGQAIRMSGRVCAVFQWRLAHSLVALRHATLQVVEAGEAWRVASGASGMRLVRLGTALRSVPEPIVHEGVNYLLKILSDLINLPLTGGSDPFLMRWFGEDAKWWHPNGGEHSLNLLPRFRTLYEPPPPFPTERLRPSCYAVESAVARAAAERSYAAYFAQADIFEEGGDSGPDRELRERIAAWAASTSSCKCSPCRLRSTDAGRAGR